MIHLPRRDMARHVPTWQHYPRINTKKASPNGLTFFCIVGLDRSLVCAAGGDDGRADQQHTRPYQQRAIR